MEAAPVLNSRQFRWLMAVIAMAVVCTALLAAGDAVWKRVANTPIISPEGTSWESAGTFNPAVIRHGAKIVMLYRAQDTAGTSRLGYAESEDGVHFTRPAEPVLVPEADYEKGGGGGA